jgi:hypothetical protein
LRATTRTVASASTSSLSAAPLFASSLGARRAMSLDPSAGLTDEQKEFQTMALDFANNELKPHGEFRRMPLG